MDKVKHYAPLIVLGIFILPLCGCMMGMHGMEDHGPSHKMSERAKTFEKEIHEKDVKLTLDVPALYAEEEAVLVLTASRILDGTPLTGATVTFLVERLRQSPDGSSVYDVVTSDEREAEEVASKGIYQVRYKFGEQGLYRITAHMGTGEKESPSAPMTISLTQNAGGHEGRNTGESMTPWMVIGGIGMAVMMLFMAL